MRLSEEEAPGRRVDKDKFETVTLWKSLVAAKRSLSRWADVEEVASLSRSSVGRFQYENRVGSPSGSAIAAASDFVHGWLYLYNLLHAAAILDFNCAPAGNS